MRSYLVFSIALVFGLVVFASPMWLHAVIITTADGDGQDQFVSEQSSGNDTPGLDHRLFNRTRGGSTQRHEVTFLRFDLSSALGAFEDAKLELFQLSGGSVGDFEIFGLNDDPSEISSPWGDPNAFTYLDAPGLTYDGDTGSADFNSAVTSLGTFAVSGSDSVTKSFSNAAITAFLNADTNGVATFLLNNPTTGATVFRSSRETALAGGPFTGNEHAPRLDVTLLPTVVEINRDSSNISIVNNSGADLTNVVSYSMISTAGTLDSSQWLSIADNYDASVVGPNQVDPDNDWTELTTAPTSKHDLSESEFEDNGGLNNGADFLDGTSTNLGNAWIPHYDEDVEMELVFDDGNTMQLEVRYTGNGGNAFQFGDLDFDGDVDEDDFLNEFLPHFGDNTSALISDAEQYQLGDLDGNGAVSFEDFFRLNNAYLAANPGALALSLTSVPEPTTLLLLTMAAGLVFGRRRVA